LALGDWHSVKEIAGTGGVIRTAYSGTPEPTNFGETDSGYVLLVEIETHGARPRLEKHKVAELEWWNPRAEIRQAGDLGRLIKTIKERRNPERTLVKLQLNGVLLAAEAALVEELPELLSGRFHHGEMDDSALLPDPADDSWINNLPDGIVREVAERLKKTAQDKKDPIATRALLELYCLANGGTA
jgi:DNA repair exonuclease SbcCD nuclease subunit